MSGSGRSYLVELSQSFMARVAMTAFRLIRNALLARVLGPEARGLFALISTLPELLTAVGAGGLNAAVAFQSARQKPAGQLLAQVLVYGCLFCLLLALLAALFLGTLGSGLALSLQLGNWLWLVVIVVPIFVLKSSLLTLHNAAGQVGAFNLLRMMESALPLLAFLSLFWFWQTHGLAAAVASWVLGLLVVIALSLRILRREGDFRLHWPAGEQKAFLGYAARSHPDALFQQLLLRVDYLFVGTLLGSEQLGYYAIATAAVELMLIVPEAVTTPLMKRLLRQGTDVAVLVPLALRVTGAVMVVASLIMFAVGDHLIVLLFGSSYLPAYQPLVALLPGIVGLCFASILRLDLLGKNRGMTLSWLAGFGAFLNIVLNLLLIPRLGLLGAAWASSISYLAATVALMIVYRRLSGCPIKQMLLVSRADIGICLRALKGSKQ